MVRHAQTACQLSAMLLLAVQLVSAQLRCSGRWAYVCEGSKQRSLNDEIRVRDVMPDTADSGSRSAREHGGNDDWFMSLLGKIRRRVDNDRRSKDSSHPGIANSLTAKAQTGLDDLIVVGRLQQLARRQLHGVDDIVKVLDENERRHENSADRDSSEEYIPGGTETEASGHDEEDTSVQDDDASMRSRLLTKWLEAEMNR